MATILQTFVIVTSTSIEIYFHFGFTSVITAHEEALEGHGTEILSVKHVVSYVKSNREGI